MRWWPIVLLMWILSGCEHKHVSRMYDRTVQGARIDALRLSAADPALKEMVRTLLKKKHLSVRDDARYTLQVDASRYARHCNNPQTCAYDATYDGFAKLTLMRNMHPIYMVQCDYHGRLNSAILEALFDQMVKQMKLKLP